MVDSKPHFSRKRMGFCFGEIILMKRENLFLIIVLNFLIFGCVTPEQAPQPTWQRTDDLYDSPTNTYHNKSVSFKIAFPEKKWKIYPRQIPKNIQKKMGINSNELENKFNIEIAMFGLHNSGMVLIQVLVEHNISDLPPLDYLKLIKEVNKKELSKIDENFTRERKIGEVDCIEWDYKFMETDYVKVTPAVRELIFLRNNYACRIRILTPTFLYMSEKVKIESLLDNISFP
jgi:hypothetical protein